MKDSEQSTSWSEEPPVNPSLLPDCEKVLKTQEVTSCLPILESLKVSDLGGSFGKMSLESCQVIADGILVPLSERWGNWGMGGPTESWTLNGSEYPKHADVCSLSDILETQDVPPRFYLSRKACAGVLRRVGQNRKVLPQMLLTALEAVATEESRPPEENT